jgi:hypothetical protein
VASAIPLKGNLSGIAPATGFFIEAPHIEPRRSIMIEVEEFIRILICGGDAEFSQNLQRKIAHDI